MRTINITALILAGAAAALAQQWEVGGGAGAAFLPTVGVSSSFGTANAGFQSGFSFSAFGGQNLYRHFSGELHYAYSKSDLKLSSGGTTATFSGASHVFHYDFVWHTNRKEAREQLYAAVGAGMKIYDGTGQEQAYQQLSQFGYFTKTRALKPMGTAAVGVKFALAPRIYLRAEFRDYVTGFPTKVLTPAPGTKYGSILHDFRPMVGISYAY